MKEPRRPAPPAETETFEATPYLAKLRLQLKRQTSKVIETQTHINALEGVIKRKLAHSPNPIKTDTP